jgi:prophage DNA circulation protein
MASAIQARLNDLFRRTALVHLARASAAYQPTSQDDASARRASIVALFDAEILIAADQREDGAYRALCDLRDSVSRDLIARGASLAPIRIFDVPAALPADVLANRLYRSPARGDELIQEVAPIHPLFMPLTFSALAN